MRIRCLSTLAELPPGAWDQLAHGAGPFLKTSFLGLLEETGCLEPHGWEPHHLVAEDGGRVVGALPLYVKDNSFGEFVFDWSWAEAYERAGGSYYPKLVSAVPFTPVTGPRLLVAPDADRNEVATALTRGAIEEADQLRVSSLHCLFPTDDEAALMESNGMMRRMGCQYHWHNPGYRDFQDFLDSLTAKRRKEIRRERRAVQEAGIEIEVLDGSRMTASLWARWHEFYCSTFHRKWGEPRLTREFFERLGALQPADTLVFLATRAKRPIAAAFAVRDEDVLYGRHWGCEGYQPQLHFELCYYRTIEYCIANRLQRLDAGAQGEHKLSRGFLPVPTWSTHWLRDPGFARAVRDFLARETQMVRKHIDALDAHSPYREPE